MRNDIEYLNILKDIRVRPFSLVREFDVSADSCAFCSFSPALNKVNIYYQSHRNYDEAGGIFGDIAFRTAFCALLWGDTDIC